MTNPDGRSDQKAWIRSCHVPFMPGVEAVRGVQIANRFRRHIHRVYILGAVASGGRIITCSQGAVHIGQGEIFVLRPGEAHACSSVSEAGHSYLLLGVDPAVMQALASHICEAHEALPLFCNVRIRDSELFRKFKRLFSAMENPASDIQVEELCHDLISSLLVVHSESVSAVSQIRPQKDRIDRVVRFIQTHYAQNLSLRDLADVACLSPFHFQREFKGCLGITPGEYVMDWRIGQSKRLLLEGVDLAGIAGQMGFADQSHFTRIFKKSVGVTPGRYRAVNRNPMDPG